jgi:hypothetical protein
VASRRGRSQQYRILPHHVRIDFDRVVDLHKHLIQHDNQHDNEHDNDHDNQHDHTADNVVFGERSKTMKRAIMLGTAALTLAVAAAGTPTPAAAGGHDNVVVVTNWKDDSFKYRFSLKVVRLNGKTVDETNAAVAVASCSSCETVAVAFEVLLVMTDPVVFTPENLAIAMNVDCSSCQTLASAYQWVIGTGGRIQLTKVGKREINEIRHELQALRHVELPIGDLQARIDELAQEVQTVLATQLVTKEKTP